MNYWLMKSEPHVYPWEMLVKDKKTHWDGVRNYQARNYLMKMKKGDHCFFYHSVIEKSIVGILKVIKEFYPDPTDITGKFVVVDVKAIKKLKKPVSLQQIKINIKLKNIALLKQSRLSVMPLQLSEWNEIIKLSKYE